MDPDRTKLDFGTPLPTKQFESMIEFCWDDENLSDLISSPYIRRNVFLFSPYSGGRGRGEGGAAATPPARIRRKSNNKTGEICRFY